MVNTSESSVGVCRKILVAESSVHDLEKSVKKLVRVAKRFDLTPIPSVVIDWNSKREVTKTFVNAVRDGAEIVSETVTRVMVPVVDATIVLPDTGAVMATGGWKVLGSLSKTDEGLEVNAFNPVNLPSITPYRDRNSMECEHCKAKRNRAKTLILRNDEGRTLQVGRECAHNYVMDISASLAALEFQSLIGSVFSVDDDGEGFEYGFTGARTLRAFHTEDALAEIVACIRKDGHFQASKVWIQDAREFEGGRWEINECATWRTVLRQLTDGRKTDEELAAAYAEFDSRIAAAETERATYTDDTAVGFMADDLRKLVDQAIAKIHAERIAYDHKNLPRYPRTAEDDADAAALIEWITGLEINPEEDAFLANLKDLVDAGFVSERRIAFLAALPGAKTRWAKKQDEINNPPTTPAPTGRVEVTGEIVSIKIRANEFTGEDTYKMLVVLTDRNKVYCSLPRGIDSDSAKGKKIRFVARFDRSDKDEHFSFGSRPTLKEILP